VPFGPARAITLERRRSERVDDAALTGMKMSSTGDIGAKRAFKKLSANTSHDKIRRWLTR
jgi:hypothetical protein